MNSSEYSYKAIVWKVLILFGCLLLGVASLGVIGRNVVNYVKAEREAEKVAAEKLRHEQQERDKLARLERERQERKRKQAELRKVKQELQAKAEALDYAGKYLEAGKLLSDYEEIYAREIYSWRSELAGKYFAKHQKVINKQREDTVCEVISLLLSQNYAIAAKTMEKYPPPVPKVLQKIVSELADIDVCIAETFKKDIGGLLIISLNSGSTLTAKLAGVKHNKLTVERGGKKQEIAIGEIAVIERQKRIGFLSKEARALYLGVDAWKCNRKQEAYARFKQLPGFLGEQFSQRLGTHEKSKTEKAARIELISLLKNASLIDDDIDSDLIQSRLIAREASSGQDRKLKKQVDDFSRRYRRSGVFVANESIIMDLASYLNEKVNFLEFTLQGGISDKKHVLNLDDQPPAAFWDIPPTNNPRKYAKLKVGKHGSVNIVLEQSNKPSAQFAFDDDTNFSNKPKLPLGRWRQITFLCSYGDGTPPRKYAIEFKYDVKNRKLLYRTACKRQGVVEVDGIMYEITVIDHGASGDYSSKGMELIMVTLPDKKKLKSFGNSYRAKGKLYELVSINTAGTHVKFE